MAFGRTGPPHDQRFTNSLPVVYLVTQVGSQLKISPKGKYKDFRPVILFEVAIIQIRPLKKTALGNEA